MLVSRRRDSRRVQLIWMVGQALFVVLCIYLYFRIRNITEGSRAVAVEHAQDIVDLERSLGIYVEDTLQQPFLNSGMLSSLANAVYIYGHWPVIAANWLVNWVGCRTR